MGLFGRPKARKRPASAAPAESSSGQGERSPSTPSQAMIDRYAAKLAAIAFERRALLADVHRSRVRTWDGHAYLPCGSTGRKPSDSTFYLDLDDGRIYRAVREGSKLTQTEPAAHRTAHGLRRLLVSAGIPVPDPPAEWSDHRWPKARGR